MLTDLYIFLQLGVCTQEPSREFCHLFPLPDNFNPEDISPSPRRPNVKGTTKTPKDIVDDLCALPNVSIICELIDK